MYQWLNKKLADSATVQTNSGEPTFWGLWNFKGPFPTSNNLTNYRDTLRLYEMGIGVYSKVNIKYFNLSLK